MSVESDDALNAALVVLITVALGLGAFFCSFCGCQGALFQKQLVLCGFATCMFVLGFMLVVVSWTARTYVLSQGPVVFKTVNRICGPGAPEVFKTGLGCAPGMASNTSLSMLPTTAVPAQNISMTELPTTVHTTTSSNLLSVAATSATSVATPTASATARVTTSMRTVSTTRTRTAVATTRPGSPSKSTAVPEGEGEGGGAGRRLLRLDGSAFSSSSSFASSPSSSSSSSAAAGAAWAASRLPASHEAAVAYALAVEAWQGGRAQGAGRRLFPGTTEESLMIRVCSRLGPGLCSSPCALVDTLCRQPEGFNPWTACACDRSGPRRATPSGGLAVATCPQDDENPMCQVDSSGRHAGAFCMSPKLEVAGSKGDEACFVLPTTQCPGARTSPGCKLPSPEATPCTSTGPCTSPDPRSEVLVHALSWANGFFYTAWVLGVLCVLASFCACCLFAEYHTGQSTGENLKSLVANEERTLQLQEEDDSDDFSPIPRGLAQNENALGVRGNTVFR